MLLPDLIERSELVLYGEIVTIADRVFELKIFQVANGEYERDHIPIAKFENWTCAARSTPYEIGQEEVVFLQKDLTNGQWIIMRAGNEAEMLEKQGSLRHNGLDTTEPNIVKDFC